MATSPACRSASASASRTTSVVRLVTVHSGALRKGVIPTPVTNTFLMISPCATRSGDRSAGCAQVAGDEQTLHLRGALRDGQDAGVLVVPHHSALLHEAVAAV